MPETANQVEIKNSHIRLQQPYNKPFTSKLKNLNRTVVISNTKCSLIQRRKDKRPRRRFQAAGEKKTEEDLPHRDYKMIRRVMALCLCSSISESLSCVPKGRSYTHPD